MSVIKDIVEYQPTKAALAWTAVGASALTVAAGFMLGVWVTAGTAQDLADKAATSARAELAGGICAENFRTSADARAQHEEISGLSLVRQRQFIQGQPWALYPGAESITRDMAGICAQMIVQMDPAELAAPAAVEEPTASVAVEPL